MCQLIQEAQSYIYIESSTFLSYEKTKNRIAHFLVERLVKTYHNPEDTFKCIILTNAYHVDETMFERGDYINERIKYTLEWIMKEIETTYSLPPLEFRDRIIVGAFEQSVQISGMLFVQDGTHCILSTSSLCDRSLASQNSELALLLRDRARIASLETILWINYIPVSDEDDKKTVTCVFDELFEYLSTSKDQDQDKDTNVEETANVNINIVRRKAWMNPSVRRKFMANDLILQHLIGGMYIL